MCTLLILVLQVCMLYIQQRHATEKVMISTKLQLLCILRDISLQFGVLFCRKPAFGFSPIGREQ